MKSSYKPCQSCVSLGIQSVIKQGKLSRDNAPENRFAPVFLFHIFIRSFAFELFRMALEFSRVGSTARFPWRQIARAHRPVHSGLKGLERFRETFIKDEL